MHEAWLFGRFRPCDEHVDRVCQLVALGGFHVDDRAVGGGDFPANTDLSASSAGFLDYGGEEEVRGRRVGRGGGHGVGAGNLGHFVLLSVEFCVLHCQ